MSTATPKGAETLRHPRYPAENFGLERTPEKDDQALKMAEIAWKVFVKRQRSGRETQSYYGTAAHLEHISRENNDRLTDRHFPSSGIYNTLNQARIPLKSMYENTGTWPKNWPEKSQAQQRKKFDPMSGATQYSFTNIGFPRDKSLVVEDFEKETHIDTDQEYFIQLEQDIIDIKTKPAKEIADDGVVQVYTKFERTIETFKLDGRTVAKATFRNIDVYGKKPYSELQLSKTFESDIDENIGLRPDICVEQWIAAHILLSTGRQIGGRTSDYWKRAQDLAQRQLYLAKDLGLQTHEMLFVKGSSVPMPSNDKNFVKMLSIVSECIKSSPFNPYHQALRDEHAVSHNMFHHVKADILMALDAKGAVIAFSFSDPFRALLSKRVEAKVAESLETYSTLHPVPIPDMTRDGLHWTNWLAKRPDLDFRNPSNDPRLAKSGAYRFGTYYDGFDYTADGNILLSTRDLVAGMSSESSHVQAQFPNLRSSALGACTEVVRFFFRALDPGLLAEYTKVAAELSKQHPESLQTRREGEIFSMRNVLVNALETDRRDIGGWHHGLTGLVSVGNYQGGDLLLWELGLRIASPPGSVHLLRGRELRYSTTPWTGRRFVVAGMTHEAVRRWALWNMGEPTPSSSASEESGIDVDLEDVRPEVEKSEHEDRGSDSQQSNTSSSSWSIDEELPRRRRGRTKQSRYRGSSTSDADTEGSGSSIARHVVKRKKGLGRSRNF
ncbi:hypothetical protein F5Y04DRAFT_292009 [Hypomontagnella monticulosa]|nr:hypothetical protein F5Y04DRAFT_292009 [Hypomontagnella monticulosa]